MKITVEKVERVSFGDWLDKQNWGVRLMKWEDGWAALAGLETDWTFASVDTTAVLAVGQEMAKLSAVFGNVKFYLTAEDISAIREATQ